MRQPIRSLYHWSHSLRGQVTLSFGAVIIGALLAAGIYLIEETSEDLINLTGASLNATARSANQLLSANMLYREQEIGLLAHSRLFTLADLENDHNITDVLEQRKKIREGFAWLGVTNVNGKVLQGTDNLLIGADASERPWFREALQGSYVGDLHEAKLLAQKLKTPVEGEPLRFIDFAAPIYDKNMQIKGVLGSHAHWQWVTNTVESVITDDQTARGTEIMIAGSDGSILFPQRHAGKSKPPSARAGRTKFEMLAWPGEGDFLTVVIPFQARSATQTNLGWQIIARQPYDSVLRDITDLRKQLLAIGAIIILLMLLIIYRIAGRVSRPIEQLSIEADNLQNNAATDTPSAGSTHEMLKIREVFEKMASSLRGHERELREMNASLERKVTERTEQLNKANVELERIAITDGLTGVYNRRYFDQRLQQSFHLMKRTKRGFSLLLLDIDHFKQINDTYGHQTGDEVLRQFAELLAASVRSTDLVARYGGEEFVVILNEAGSENEAMTAATKIAEAIRSHAFPKVGKLTSSIGVTTAHTGDSNTEYILQRADQGVYIAKSAGRDQIKLISHRDCAPAGHIG